MTNKKSMVDTNGVKLHITEAGEGPLVLLLHGFPELGYSWRHQLAPLAEAGYRAVAPDQRGYGKSDRPAAVEAYHMFQLTTDIVDLVEALGETEAILVGHDFGSLVSQSCALMRPDIFKAVALLSVPYSPRRRGNMRPTERMEQMAGDAVFYINYFQEPGKVEKELERNVRESMLMMLYSASGDAPPDKSWRFIFDKSERFIDSGTLPGFLPGWVTEKDLDLFTEMFELSGFAGPVNWYRNIDANWSQTPFLNNAKILQPAVFIEGELDAVRVMYTPSPEAMKKFMPNLKNFVTLPGVGHWIQQERPEAVNKALIAFLTAL